MSILKLTRCEKKCNSCIFSLVSSITGEETYLNFPIGTQVEISPQQFQNIETEVNGLNKIFCIIRPSYTWACVCDK